jgi:hypothetical protein
MEEVVDRVVGREGTLHLPGRFEPLHLPFPPSGRLVRVLGPVVEPSVATVLDPGHHLAPGRTVARELVRDHHPRRPPLALQQLAQQALGRPLVAPALNQDVEDEPGLIDGAPQPVLHPGDHDGDLIEVPFVASPGQPAPDLVGERLAELPGPPPHGLVAHGDAAGGQHPLDHAQAEREPEVQPDRVADDLGRETMAGVAGAGGRRHAARLSFQLDRCKPMRP